MRAAHPGRWLMLAVAVALLLAAADLSWGAEGSLVGLLLVCPLLVALMLDGARAGTVCALVVALALAVSVTEHTLGDADQILRLTVLAAGSLFAACAAHQRACHDEQLAQVAAVAQRAILQPTSFRTGGSAVCARYHSAAKEAVIGGDLYAFANTATGLRLVIGDVRGKGLEAVRLSAAAIGHFRNCAYTHAGLIDVVRETDARLAGDFAPEDFLTALVAELRPGAVRLANCGHHAPLHLPVHGPPRLLAPPEPSPPLGLGPAPLLQEVALAPGDRLLFYTDGIAEARDRDGTFFDLNTVIPACRLPDLDEAMDAVLTALTRHTGGALDDDVALILIEPEPALPRPSTHLLPCAAHGICPLAVESSLTADTEQSRTAVR